MNGKYHDGNQTGKLTFKIRKNDDIEEYEKRKSNVLKKVSDDLGLELKKTEVNTKKPMYIIIKVELTSYQRI
jgi:hypothetical protein